MPYTSSVSSIHNAYKKNLYILLQGVRNAKWYSELHMSQMVATPTSIHTTNIQCCWTLIIKLVTLYKKVQLHNYVTQFLIFVQLGITEYFLQINFLYLTEKYFTLMVNVAKRWILHPLRLSYWNKEVSTNVHRHNKCLLQSTFMCCTSELKHYHLISSAQSSLGTTEQNNALYEHRNIPVDTWHKWTASKCTSMLLYSLLSPPCNKTEHIKPLNFYYFTKWQ